MKPKKTIITDYKDVEHTYDPAEVESPLLYEVRVELYKIDNRGFTTAYPRLKNAFVVPESAIQKHNLFLTRTTKKPDSTLEDRLISLLEELGVQFE